MASTPHHPEHGQTVVFDVVPAMSYCRRGESYRVERRNGGDFRFVNVATGASTTDRAWAVTRSSWRTA